MPIAQEWLEKTHSPKLKNIIVMSENTITRRTYRRHYLHFNLSYRSVVSHPNSVEYRIRT